MTRVLLPQNTKPAPQCVLTQAPTVFAEEKVVSVVGVLTRQPLDVLQLGRGGLRSNSSSAKGSFWLWSDFRNQFAKARNVTGRCRIVACL